MREHNKNICNTLPKLPFSTVQGALQWQPWQQQRGKGKGNQLRNQRTNEKSKALQEVCLPSSVGRGKVAEQKDPTARGEVFCPGDLPLDSFGFIKATHQGQDPIPLLTPSPSLCDCHALPLSRLCVSGLVGHSREGEKLPERGQGVEERFETHCFGLGESSNERVGGRQASCRTDGDIQCQSTREKSRVVVRLVENWSTNPPSFGGCGTLESEGLKNPSKVEARNTHPQI